METNWSAQAVKPYEDTEARDLLNAVAEQIEPDFEGRERAGRALLKQLRDLGDELGFHAPETSNKDNVALHKGMGAVSITYQVMGPRFLLRGRGTGEAPLELRYNRRRECLEGDAIVTEPGQPPEGENALSVLTREAVKILRASQAASERRS